MAAAPGSTTLSAVTIVLLAAAVLIGHGDGATVVKDTKEDLVVEACKKVSREFCEVRFTKDFCVSVLRRDKRSAEATEYCNLTLVAVDLVEHHANETAAKIDGILRAGVKEKRAEYVLRYCRADCEAILRTTGVCRAMHQEAQELWSTDNDCAVRLVNAAKNCASEMKDKTTALGKDAVDELTKLASLTSEMVDLMDFTYY